MLFRGGFSWYRYFQLGESQQCNRKIARERTAVSKRIENKRTILLKKWGSNVYWFVELKRRSADAMHILCLPLSCMDILLSHALAPKE